MQDTTNNPALRFFTLPDTDGFDVIWDVFPSKSGLIYVSACCEAVERGGKRLAQHTKLYAFDPATEEFTLAVDMAVLSGDVFTGRNVIHGKIHFSLCEGADGTIYGGTHMHYFEVMKKSGDRNDWWRKLTDPDEGYVGGKLFAYYPESGGSQVLAVPQPHQGIRVMTIDSRNGRIYGIGFPWSNLWRYDLATGECRNLGEVPYRNPYGLEVDKHGRVFTLNSRGEMMRYDPSTDMLVTLPVKAPKVVNDDETLCELKTRLSGESMIGTTLLGCRAFEYFPYEGNAGRIRDLGELYPLPEDRDYNVSETVMEGQDGYLYFCLVLGAEASQETRLVRIDPQNPQARAEDLGRIYANGEPVWGTFRGGTGRDGKLYFAALQSGEKEHKLMLGQIDPKKLPTPKAD